MTNQYQAPAIHLVLRFSDRLGKIQDTVSEHIAIIERHGQVWFGKLGKPLGQPNVKKINQQVEKGIPTYLYLVQKGDQGYSTYRGRIVCVTTEFPAGEEQLIPTYYSALNGPDIRFWVKVFDLHPAEADALSRLASVTSPDPIKHTLASSMAGFFIAREIKRSSA